jgi:hypothetical protein
MAFFHVDSGISGLRDCDWQHHSKNDACFLAAALSALIRLPHGSVRYRTLWETPPDTQRLAVACCHRE